MQVGRRAATVLMSPSARSASATAAPQQRDVGTQVCSSANDGDLDRDLLPFGHRLGLLQREGASVECLREEGRSPSRLAASTASRLTLSRRAPSAVCMSSVPSAPSVRTRSGRSSVGIASSAVSSSATSSRSTAGRAGSARCSRGSTRRPLPRPTASRRGREQGPSRSPPRPALANLVGALDRQTQATRSASSRPRRSSGSLRSIISAAIAQCRAASEYAPCAAATPAARFAATAANAGSSAAPAAAWVATSAAWSSPG